MISTHHQIILVYHLFQTKMGVSKNNGTPKSSILIGFSIINHPFWGTPIFWKHPNGDFVKFLASLKHLSPKNHPQLIPPGSSSMEESSHGPQLPSAPTSYPLYVRLRVCLSVRQWMGFFVPPNNIEETMMYGGKPIHGWEEFASFVIFMSFFSVWIET